MMKKFIPVLFLAVAPITSFAATLTVESIGETDVEVNVNRHIGDTMMSAPYLNKYVLNDTIEHIGDHYMGGWEAPNPIGPSMTFTSTMTVPSNYAVVRVEAYDVFGGSGFAGHEVKVNGVSIGKFKNLWDERYVWKEYSFIVDKSLFVSGSNTVDVIAGNAAYNNLDDIQVRNIVILAK